MSTGSNTIGSTNPLEQLTQLPTAIKLYYNHLITIFSAD